MTANWVLRPPTGPGPILFGFPYAGGGASLFRQWPAKVGDSWWCPLQPPGREHRFREPPLRTHTEFAEAVADYLAGFADREVSFFGHCGGVPLALSTITELARRGQRLPTRLYASGWGAPHLSLYGRLNFLDLATADLHAEVRALFERMGAAVREDFVDLAATVLRVDLELHRPHLYDAAKPVPVPVTVIGWTRDDVVPAQVACRDWEQVAQVSYEVLDGEHFDFMHCPDELAKILTHP